jgi:hypothetical protein
MTDPNVRTGPGGEEIVLEPGDEGYVDPQIAGPPTLDPSIPPTGDGPDAPSDSGTYLNPELPVAQTPEEVAAPQDLSAHTEAEMLAARGTVVDSQNATDLVPNMPQIRMGNPVESDPEAEEAAAQAEAEAQEAAFEEAQTAEPEPEPAA